MSNSSEAQQLLSKWFPSFKVINVHCDGYEPVAIEASGSGIFFTGGVDSFYSVLTTDQMKNKLIYVQGFDVPLNDVGTAKAVIKQLKASAHALERELIVLRTNIRDFADAYVSWGQTYHGAALASVGLSLSLKKVYIASTFTSKGLHPWGSHPDLDHLWSTDSTDIIHDSISVNRVDKVRHIKK